MGLLDRYAYIHNCGVSVEHIREYVPTKTQSVHILSDIHPITIAEIDPKAMNTITAHKLKDYRRKTFSLMLLPDVHIMLDELTKDVGRLEDYNEFKR